MVSEFLFSIIIIAVLGYLFNEREKRKTKKQEEAAKKLLKMGAVCFEEVKHSLPKGTTPHLIAKEIIEEYDHSNKNCGPIDKLWEDKKHIQIISDATRSSSSEESWKACMILYDGIVQEAFNYGSLLSSNSQEALQKVGIELMYLLIWYIDNQQEEFEVEDRNRLAGCLINNAIPAYVKLFLDKQYDNEVVKNKAWEIEKVLYPRALIYDNCEEFMNATCLLYKKVTVMSAFSFLVFRALNKTYSDIDEELIGEKEILMSDPTCSPDIKFIRKTTTQIVSILERLRIKDILISLQ